MPMRHSNFATCVRFRTEEQKMCTAACEGENKEVQRMDGNTGMRNKDTCYTFDIPYIHTDPYMPGCAKMKEDIYIKKK